MRNRSISGEKRANQSYRCLDEEVGHITVGGRVFVVVLAPRSSVRIAPSLAHRFKIEDFELAAVETPNEHERRVEADDIASRLTGRELEIAALVAQGYATKNIAFRLQISEWTVATYLRRIFAKLDVSSRAAMVYRCAPLIDRAAETPLAKHYS
jgi:DNA-binding CsgD family transcriptional regulator